MISAFIPCRANSQRVPQKNTRPFAGFPGGLLELKLRQLARVDCLSDVVVSSNDERVLAIAGAMDDELELPIRVLRRPHQYGRSDTSMQRFIEEYVSTLDFQTTVLWTHVTHPLMTSREYLRTIEAYDQAMSRGHDSLVTVTKVQDFLWRDGRPFNYDPEHERWPRSQDIEPLWAINHAAYLIERDRLRAVHDRVGERPFLLELSRRSGIDIDWPEDFNLAEELVVAGRRQSSETEGGLGVL